jgi:hypothetical protein
MDPDLEMRANGLYVRTMYLKLTSDQYWASKGVSESTADLALRSKVLAGVSLAVSVSASLSACGRSPRIA